MVRKQRLKEETKGRVGGGASLGKEGREDCRKEGGPRAFTFGPHPAGVSSLDLRGALRLLAFPSEPLTFGEGRIWKKSSRGVANLKVWTLDVNFFAYYIW